MRLIIEERFGIPSILYKDGGRSIIAEEMAKAINSALGQIKGVLQPLLPVGVTGKLQQALTISPAVSKYRGNRVEGRLFNKGYAKRYAGVVEWGRSPNSKRPPKGSLVAWIMRKKGLSKKEAQKADFLIRRKIGRQGIMPKLHWASNMPRFRGIAQRELSKGLGFALNRIRNSAKGKRRLDRLGL